MHSSCPAEVPGMTFLAIKILVGLRALRL